MYGYDATGTEELVGTAIAAAVAEDQALAVGAAIAAAVAEDRALGVALAVGAAAAGAPYELPTSSVNGFEAGFWGRAAMAHHAAGPLGLLRRA
ncbi:MAG: hypothetical protein JXB32_04415 [Deltaproteobacteria bacterium]|nr:hypothetical protein [Deltaproteobacteria bacterium]